MRALLTLVLAAEGAKSQSFSTIATPTNGTATSTVSTTPSVDTTIPLHVVVGAKERSENVTLPANECRQLTTLLYTHHLPLLMTCSRISSGETIDSVTLWYPANCSLTV